MTLIGSFASAKSSCWISTNAVAAAAAAVDQLPHTYNEFTSERKGENFISFQSNRLSKRLMLIWFNLLVELVELAATAVCV